MLRHVLNDRRCDISETLEWRSVFRREKVRTLGTDEKHLIGAFTQHVIVGRVDRRLLGEFRVELADVVVAFEDRLVRRFVALVIDFGPIEVTKERVALAKSSAIERPREVVALLLLTRRRRVRCRAGG